MASATKAPLIVDVKRSSLDDGPGIRSVVFFKGCPLRCVWCQNPETLSSKAEIQREPERCAACGACLPACPANRARPAAEPEESGQCLLCGKCVDACPAAARRIAGQEHDLDQLLELLLRDEPFYRRSGGGVTLSGGEPAVKARWVGKLAAGLAERSVHVLLETAGHFAWEPFERHLLPHLSAVYFDLKLADDAAHRRHTGRGNKRIHETLRNLVATDLDDLLPRVPLIPGITADTDNLMALAELLDELGLRRVALLPYNPLWIPKRTSLGLDLPYGHADWMPNEEVEGCREIFTSRDIEVIG